MESVQTRRLVAAAFIISTILAGNNPIAVRFSNVELPPFFGAGIRFGAAALLLFLIVLVRRLPLPRGRALLGAMALGVLQFAASFALLYQSLLHIQAGLASVILALAPLLTFVFAIAHRQETFQWRVLIGGVLALAGIALVFGNQIGASVPLLPMLGAVLATACIAEAAILYKSLPDAHPITTNALAMATGAAILLALSGLWGESPAWPTLPATWAAVLYLIVFGSVGVFVLALYVLSHWPATTASYQTVLMPIVTIVFAAWLAQETVTVMFLIGGALALVGVYVGVLAPRSLLRKAPGRRDETHPIPLD